MSAHVESRCSCERCQSMCKTRPCLPTPDEAKKLDRTMQVEFVLSSSDSDERKVVTITSPAIVGKEGQVVDGYATGQCVYFNDGLCGLHAKGLKPMEGRIAHHSVPWQASRAAVLERWNIPVVGFR